LRRLLHETTQGRLSDGHMSALLERLARFCGHDTQRIGPGRRRA
jgi:hypothetical protein